MKKIFNNRKFLLTVLLLSSAAFIAGVPLNENKTVLEQIIESFPSGEADKAKQEEAKRSMNDELWAEIEKISAANADDSLTMEGKIRLYDDLDDNGIKEEEHFVLHQVGDNQWLRLDSFERVQVEHTLFMVDHQEKEIAIQPSGAIDSVYAAFRIMDPVKFRELLVKDGTTIDISHEGALNVLNVKPGSMDAVNEYHIFYDAATYEIKKIRLAYTSFPYQDYLENYQEKENTSKKDSVQQVADPVIPGNAADSVNSDDIEMNITQYVLEFDISRKEKKCDFNFFDNVLYGTSRSGDVTFRGKLAGYKKIQY